jgi:hypothetical protein
VSADARWVAFVESDDRTGTFTGLASVFSSRGVSFESVSTHESHDGTGLVVVVFETSERIQRVLARTLERLAVTRSVDVRPAGDPSVRAIGVVRTAPGTAFRPSPQASLVWTGDSSTDEAVLVIGPLLAVERALREARAAGAATVMSAVLPLADAPLPGAPSAETPVSGGFPLT